MKESGYSKIYNYPIKAIGLTLIISTLIVIFCLFQYIYLQKRNEEIQSKHISLTLNIGRIMLLDEVLTMSARMAAATGDMNYEERYNKFEPELDLIIKDTIRMFKGKYTDQYVKETDRANMSLVEMERHSFALMRSGRMNDASFILNSPEYLMQKGLYSQGMKNTLSALQTESNQSLQNEKIYTLIFYGFGITGLVIIFVAWIVSIRALQRWLNERRQIQEALYISEKRFRSLADSAPAGIFLTDAQGRINYTNKSWQTITGLLPEESLNSTWYQVIHPDEQETLIKEWKKCLEEGRIFSKETRLLSPAGYKRWVSILTSRIGSEHESTTGFVGTVLDISERKLFENKLRESEEKYRDLFDNANDLIQSVDQYGRFVYVNKKWKDVIGYSDQEVKNLTLLDIIRKDYIPHCMEIFQEIQKGKDIENIEAVFITKGGAEIFVEGKLSARMLEGKFISTQGIFRDVTDRKRLESQLLHERNVGRS